MRIAFNPNNPLGRHTGAGRYPAIENAPQSGQNQGVVPLAWGICNHLDTGLTVGQFILSLSKSRYDAVFSNGLFGISAEGRLWPAVFS